MADHCGCPLIVDTKLGKLRVEFSPRGVCRLQFVTAGRASMTGPLARQLQAYASGRPVRFTTKLDLSAGTKFQQAVWRVLRTIPRGETRSYGWVARQIGKPKASRAVGAACGANPVPILVPCHRVVAGDGSLGGFTGGLARKRKLLAVEECPTSRSSDIRPGLPASSLRFV